MLGHAVLIRPLTVADAQAFWDIRLRAFTESPASFNTSPHEWRAHPLSEVERMLSGETGSPSDIVLGAFEPELLWTRRPMPRAAPQAGSPNDAVGSLRGSRVARARYRQSSFASAARSCPLAARPPHRRADGHDRQSTCPPRLSTIWLCAVRLPAACCQNGQRLSRRGADDAGARRGGRRSEWLVVIRFTAM